MLLTPHSLTFYYMSISHGQRAFHMDREPLGTELTCPVGFGRVPEQAQGRPEREKGVFSGPNGAVPGSVELLL